MISRAVTGTALTLCAFGGLGAELANIDCADWGWDFIEAADAEDIAACLDAGADPDVGLLLATNWGTPAKVQMLFDGGADPNLVDSEGMPLIYSFARYSARHVTKRGDVARILLAAGADPNSRFIFPRPGAAHGETALHVTNNPEVAQALIDGGADPNITDTAGLTPLHKTRYGDVAKVLIAAGADPHAATDNGWTPLHSAGSAYDGSSMTETLLALDADVDARTADGVTPLHVADEPESAALLIAAGADVRRRDRSGRTPLHVLAQREEGGGSIGILVSEGARVNARDARGQTPLHKSVLGYFSADTAGRVPTIRALVDHGADIDARDQEGNTPLHLAAMSAWYRAGAAIDTLLDAGATAGLRNERRQTAWKLASQNDNEDLKASEAYWRLNEARFDSPDAEAALATERLAPLAELTQDEDAEGRAATASGESRTDTVGGPGACEIPGFPSPAHIRGLGLSWCPSSVDFQLRAIALQAAGAWCGIRTGSASTRDEVAVGHDLVNTACDRLDALGGNNTGPSCRCPSGYRP